MKQESHGFNRAECQAYGFLNSRNAAIKAARKIGFKTDEDNQNVCPCCAGVVFTFDGKKYKVRATDKGIALQEKVVGDWDKEKDYYLSSEVLHKTKEELVNYAISYLKIYPIDFIEKNYGS